MFPNRNFRRRALAALGIASLPAFAAGGLPAIPFAEEFFPELQLLLDQAATAAAEPRLGALRVEERAGDLEVARSQRRPSVRLHARLLGSYEVREDIDDTLRGLANVNLTVTQPLYQWGNLERQQRIAEQRLFLESLEQGRLTRQHRMQLRRTYLAWLHHKQRRAILEQSVALAESLAAARRQLAEAGQLAEQEALELEARLLETREGLAHTERVILDLETTLQRLVGPAFRPERLHGHPLDTIEPMPEQDFAALGKAVNAMTADAADPALLRLSVLESIEQQQLDILARRNWPMFDLVSGVYTDRLDAVNQDRSIFRTQYYAGLQINWNIFDGWQTAGLKRSALARKRALAVHREAAEQEWRQRARNLLAELALNRTQLDARGKRQQLLARRLELLREQAGGSRITATELMQGEIDYQDARQRLLEARIQYLNNLMELGVLLGVDPPPPGPPDAP